MRRGFFEFFRLIRLFPIHNPKRVNRMSDGNQQPACSTKKPLSLIEDISHCLWIIVICYRADQGVQLILVIYVP